MGTKLQLSTADHPETDVLSENNIQTLEEMIGRYCGVGIEYQDGVGAPMVGKHCYLLLK